MVQFFNVSQIQSCYAKDLSFCTEGPWINKKWFIINWLINNPIHIHVNLFIKIYVIVWVTFSLNFLFFIHLWILSIVLSTFMTMQMILDISWLISGIRTRTGTILDNSLFVFSREDVVQPVLLHQLPCGLLQLGWGRS